METWGLVSVYLYCTAYSVTAHSLCQGVFKNQLIAQLVSLCSNPMKSALLLSSEERQGSP